MLKNKEQHDILTSRSTVAARALQSKQQAEYIRATMSNSDGTCKKHVSLQFSECECDKSINVYNAKF